MNEIKAEGYKDMPHSVKLAMSSKGLVSGEVKCYGSTPDEALERSTNLLKQVEEMIRAKNNL